MNDVTVTTGPTDGLTRSAMIDWDPVSHRFGPRGQVMEVVRRTAARVARRMDYDSVSCDLAVVLTETQSTAAVKLMCRIDDRNTDLLDGQRPDIVVSKVCSALNEAAALMERSIALRRAGDHHVLSSVPDAAHAPHTIYHPDEIAVTAARALLGIASDTPVVLVINDAESIRLPLSSLGSAMVADARHAVSARMELVALGKPSERPIAEWRMRGPARKAYTSYYYPDEHYSTLYQAMSPTSGPCDVELVPLMPADARAAKARYRLVTVSLSAMTA